MFIWDTSKAVNVDHIERVQIVGDSSGNVNVYMVGNGTPVVMNMGTTSDGDASTAIRHMLQAIDSRSFV